MLTRLRALRAFTVIELIVVMVVIAVLAAIILPKRGLSVMPGQTSTAPARRLRLGSGTSTAGLAPCCVPRPSQTGHQPSGLLNEK